MSKFLHRAIDAVIFKSVDMKSVFEAHNDGYTSFETQVLLKEKPISNGNGFVHYLYVFLQKAYSLSMD